MEREIDHMAWALANQFTRALAKFDLDLNQGEIDQLVDRFETFMCVMNDARRGQDAEV